MDHKENIRKIIVTHENYQQAISDYVTEVERIALNKGFKDGGVLGIVVLVVIALTIYLL